MKLLSHGLDSSLLEHLREVTGAAQNLEEKIICCCHDIGKATIEWQEYRRNNKPDSPHNHAASGGLLATLVIRCLGRDNAPFHALVALHSGAAHHSGLALCNHSRDEFCSVATDKQAELFFLDQNEGISSLLPEIELPILEEAWKCFKAMAPLPQAQVNEFNQWLSGGETDRLQAFMAARSLLGRMCFFDHQSAAKQSGNSSHIVSWTQAYPDTRFMERPPRFFPQSQRGIDFLRNDLKSAFHSCLERDAIFYFIDAPTGLGKTETMLSGAELLRQKYGLNRIVFAVPQVSIADQIYSEYFDNGNHVQIWNYLRQEKKTSSDKAESNQSTAFSLDIAIQPFSESYNITTFNQVVLAMCHPHRMRCIRSLGLKDAVVIMDEFHKLPMAILPYFFRMAEEYCSKNNCRFILGSATPLEEFEYLGLSGSGRIPRDQTATIYSAPTIDDRRHYCNLGKLDVNGLSERINSFHDSSEQNLLVVLNLVSEGTWPLLKNYCGTYNPWRQLEELENNDESRVIVFLDGLVPPMLRRQIVTTCKETMKKRPVTLITTQMVEVGVDLDFDHAIIDYQGIAATIQRGGRVGREGRDKSCTVEVFSLLTSSDQTSFATLCDVMLKKDARMRNIIFEDITKRTQRFWQRESRFFERWTTLQTYKDSELNKELTNIQQKVFSKTLPTNIMDGFFSEALGYGELGVDFMPGQYIAELFSGNYGTDLLILEDDAARELLVSMLDRITNPTGDKTLYKQLNRFIADRMISVSDKVKDELGLVEVGQIEYRDNLQCMMLSPPIY